jgi:hypothetical protein
MYEIGLNVIVAHWFNGDALCVNYDATYCCFLCSYIFVRVQRNIYMLCLLILVMHGLPADFLSVIYAGAGGEGGGLRAG